MDTGATTAPEALRSRQIEEVIYAATMRLDAKDFKGWLDMCSLELTYAIRAFSREIRKDVIWLEHDYEGMAGLIRQLPRHNTDQSEFTRHTTVYTITPDATGESVVVVSAVAIYRTTHDGGVTNLFGIGRYTDTLVHTPDGWRFRGRDLRLETRSLGIGTHYPL
ncbi:MAG: aromatic-ring-hydroxylating dioxygenase subunit beta [Vulcanimicrobiaceae bacterium]